MDERHRGYHGPDSASGFDGRKWQHGRPKRFEMTGTFIAYIIGAVGLSGLLGGQPDLSVGLLVVAAVILVTAQR